ncbi:hypothetical protein S83_005488, partial [Arachis hypogaea]
PLAVASRRSSLVHSSDGSGKSGSFLMEFALYPKLGLRNILPNPIASQPFFRTLSWQHYSGVSCDLFFQGSVGGTSIPNLKHPPPSRE